VSDGKKKEGFKKKGLNEIGGGKGKSLTNAWPGSKRQPEKRGIERSPARGESLPRKK